MKTYMFPGQGSQAKGMGGSLFDEFPELIEKADKILGYSIKELCLEDPRRELSKTQFTQPALYVVNALSYYKKVQDTGIKPEYVAGHSLGEFNALLAAECFDFEAGLKLVKKRGELMAQAEGGAMAAILNASKSEIIEILQKNGLTNIDLANYNSPLQIVISGAIEEIGAAQSLFAYGNVMYYPLNTSGAFHSRFMLPAKEKFEQYIKRFKLNDPVIPVLSNVTAKLYESEQIFNNLSQQIASTVLWSDGIQYLMSIARDAGTEMEFVEIGFGDVLTKMIKNIKIQTAQLDAKDNNRINPVSSDDKVVPSASLVLDSKVESAPVNGNAAILVEQWNKKYPVGARFKSNVTNYSELETRTKAMVLFGHRAAVYMKGYNGYFDLNEIAPV